LVVGGQIILAQDQDSGGYPATGDVVVCALPTTDNGSNCSTEGPSHTGLQGQTAFHRVQAINGSQVTIYPGLQAPNWRSAKNPKAWWPTTARTGVGIENMTVDGSAGSGQRANIMFDNAIGCWVQGVRSIITTPDMQKGYQILLYLANQITMQNNYFYGYRDTAQENYALTISAGVLIQNNIIQQYVAPIEDNGPGSNGFVVGYNYMLNGVGINGNPGWTIGPDAHNISDFMSLWEGNDAPKINMDAIHGTHNFFTFMRNLLYGQVGQTSNSELVDVKGRARFGNAVGNVLGRTGYYVTYEKDSSDSNTAIYGLGGSYTGSGQTAPSDTNVRRTFMQWANYDTVTGANRFCGNSSDTGWATTCASTSEVPTGITNFPNPVPTLGDTVAGQGALPTSFYLSSKPAWFGSVPWPANGPDVSGGNISGYAGHANKIPARVCFESLVNDSAYSTTPPIKSFNADSCYAAAGSVTVAPSSIAFGNVVVNTSSSPTTVTLTNNSGSTITLTGESFTGTNASDFSRSSDNCNSGTVTNGSTCTVAITFTPTAAVGTNETATLNIPYTGVSGSPQTVSLSGTSASDTGVAPAIQVIGAMRISGSTKVN
jgi:hypothetical protein